MLIALDYDETYTCDPIFWNLTIDLAYARGHSVIVVTMRHKDEGFDVIDALSNRVEQIIFTGRKAKGKFVSELGYNVSVWIDDNPNFIVSDAMPRMTLGGWDNG